VRDRPPELPNLEKFCGLFRVTFSEVAGFMAEDGFMEAVVSDLDHWRETTCNVIQAVQNNAMDKSRSDQMVWVLAFMRIVKHPAARELSDLVPAE
jgi:hypothetical protein